MLLMSEKVFDTVIHGTTALYSDPSSWERLGLADAVLVEVRTAQNGGSTPSITVRLQESNDGVFWNTRATLVSGVALNANTNQIIFANDAGTTPFGRFIRFETQLAGTTPVSNVQIYVSARQRD